MGIMGCNCSKDTNEVFNLSTDRESTPFEKGNEGPVAAKSGNFNIATSNQVTLFTQEGNTERRSTKRHLDKKQNFIEHFLITMNSCRKDPASFASIVESHIQYIEDNNDSNSKNATFYVREGMPKIPLTRGASAFRECADRLRSMEPMKKLELRLDLVISVPEDVTNWTSKQHIAESLKEFKLNNKAKSNGYNKFNFHYDVGSPYSEIAFILQLVDDTPFKGARSKNILNPNFTYVGISSQKQKNRHCGYYLFAN